MGLDIMPHVAAVHLGAFTGSSGTQKPLFVAKQATRIVAIQMMDNTTIGLHASNYGVMTIQNKGSTGSSTTSVASLTTATTALTANLPRTLTLSTTESALEVAAGEGLTAVWTEVGASRDLVAANVTIHYAIGTGAGA